VILPPDTLVSADGDGVVRLRSPYDPGPYPVSITERLDFWAEVAPRRTFLAARDESGDWLRLDYATVQARVRAVAQSLLDRKLSPERPVLILSGNGLEHAVLGLAAMYVGIPYAPISPSYCLLSRDFTTLSAVARAVAPGLILAADGPQFEAALGSIGEGSAEIVTVVHAPGLRAQTRFDDLLARAPTRAVADAHASVAAGTIAKILFTSGSTGAPKGVITTHGMLAVNQAQLATAMPCLTDPPPVLCDWLPWNHTFGGSHNFGLVLHNGGTIYVDAGTPTHAGFATTLANLRDVAPTHYFNVPRGYELLLPALRSDPSLREVFFSRVQLLFYAAAGLRQEVSQGFQALAVETRGVPIPWVSGLGATETAPFAIFTGPMPAPIAGRIGVPAPGVEMKVAPVGAALEARVRGPNVTPGYWKDPQRTAVAFDDEGFYRMGDAVTFVDADDPGRGFDFAGRLTEDFKLSTGTWVRVGPLRGALLAHLGDLVQDVVVAGHDREAVTLLVFPNLAACRRLEGLGERTPAAEVLRRPGITARFESLLHEFSEAHAASSTRVARAVLLEEAPSIDAHELTDKGSVNQRAVLRNRSHLVDGLYGAAGDGTRLVVPQGSVTP
jgi:feruloyl-CoA synthase